jgi:hypothetical protein
MYTLDPALATSTVGRQGTVAVLLSLPSANASRHTVSPANPRNTAHCSRLEVINPKHGSTLPLNVLSRHTHLFPVMNEFCGVPVKIEQGLPLAGYVYTLCLFSRCSLTGPSMIFKDCDPLNCDRTQCPKTTNR